MGYKRNRRWLLAQVEQVAGLVGVAPPAVETYDHLGALDICVDPYGPELMIPDVLFDLLSDDEMRFLFAHELQNLKDSPALLAAAKAAEMVEPLHEFADNAERLGYPGFSYRRDAKILSRYVLAILNEGEYRADTKAASLYGLPVMISATAKMIRHDCPSFAALDDYEAILAYSHMGREQANPRECIDSLSGYDTYFDNRIAEVSRRLMAHRIP